MTFTIGLTGGIGSGKSTVAKLFQELGVPVFDTDIMAKQLVQDGESALKDIADEFGEEILDQSGKLDRESIKKKIFDDDNARTLLENILHPRIRQRLLANIASCDAPYCIAVIPLLIEKNWQDTVDRILVVDLPEEKQLERAAARDALPKTLLKKIIDSQVDRDTRLKHADDIIDNNGNDSLLINQVNELHQKYLRLSRKY